MAHPGGSSPGGQLTRRAAHPEGSSPGGGQVTRRWPGHPEVARSPGGGNLTWRTPGHPEEGSSLRGGQLIRGRTALPGEDSSPGLPVTRGEGSSSGGGHLTRRIAAHSEEGISPSGGHLIRRRVSHPEGSMYVLFLPDHPVPPSIMMSIRSIGAVYKSENCFFTRRIFYRAKSNANLTI